MAKKGEAAEKETAWISSRAEKDVADALSAAEIPAGVRVSLDDIVSRNQDFFSATLGGQDMGHAPEPTGSEPSETLPHLQYPGYRRDFDIRKRAYDGPAERAHLVDELRRRHIGSEDVYKRWQTSLTAQNLQEILEGYESQRKETVAEYVNNFLYNAQRKLGIIGKPFGLARKLWADAAKPYERPGHLFSSYPGNAGELLAYAYYKRGSKNDPKEGFGMTTDSMRVRMLAAREYSKHGSISFEEAFRLFDEMVWTHEQAHRVNPPEKWYGKREMEMYELEIRGRVVERFAEEYRIATDKGTKERFRKLTEIAAMFYFGNPNGSSVTTNARNRGIYNEVAIVDEYQDSHFPGRGTLEKTAQREYRAKHTDMPLSELEGEGGSKQHEPCQHDSIKTEHEKTASHEVGVREYSPARTEYQEHQPAQHEPAVN